MKQIFTSVLGKRRGYDKVRVEIKRALIAEVTCNKRKVKDVAKEMNINYSNAKHIVNLYMRTGKMRDNKSKRKAPNAHRKEKANDVSVFFDFKPY